MRRSRLTQPIVALVSVLAIAFAAPSNAQGQSAQMLSLQFSGLHAYPFAGGLASVDVGFGFEAQLRLNPSQFSIGAGIERTTHGIAGVPNSAEIVMLGGFLEPRYVIFIGSDNAVLYVSGRIAVSSISAPNFTTNGTGVTLNGGGGFLVRLGDRVNLDIGSTLGYKTLGEVDLQSGPRWDLGTGNNVVSRVGLAIGIG